MFPAFEKYSIKPLAAINLEDFQCEPTLLSFFTEDAADCENELISKTYFLVHEDYKPPLVGFSLSNNVIKAETDIDMKITYNARYSQYPAVLIGRFATHTAFERQGHGTQALDLIKNWFVTSNKTGCRFIVVDARKGAEEFYIKNGFEEYPEQNHESKTTLLYFDLRDYLFELRKG